MILEFGMYVESFNVEMSNRNITTKEKFVKLFT